MKTGVFLAATFAAASILSLQGADKYLVPDFVKELDDLGEVMEMAASSNKGITFLLMDPDSTWGPANAASSVAIEKLQKDTEIIIITGMNLHRSPQAVQDAIYSKEARGPIPVVAVTDPSAEKLISLIPYFNMKDVNGFTEAEEGLTMMRGEMVDLKGEKTFTKETWTNDKGRSIEASYVASNGTDITLKLTNGKSATIPLSTLSDESQQRAAELAQ